MDESENVLKDRSDPAVIMYNMVAQTAASYDSHARPDPITNAKEYRTWKEIALGNAVNAKYILTSGGKPADSGSFGHIATMSTLKGQAHAALMELLDLQAQAQGYAGRSLAGNLCLCPQRLRRRQCRSDLQGCSQELV